MTTNKIQVLDPALIRYAVNGYEIRSNEIHREGRVDKRIHVGPATSDQISGLFAHFYHISPSSPMAHQIAEQLIHYEVSMAGLQVSLRR